ncbi:MAG: cytochrome c family protein [Usitatibacter sp.]
MGKQMIVGMQGALVAILALASNVAAGAGDADRGAKVFRACAACHSVERGAHLTGPSLAGLWGRKAGTAAGFTRYSDALKGSAAVWGEATLDRWLADPAGFIPGNAMTFPGMSRGGEREDVIAYLRAVSSGQAAAASRPRGDRIDLKKAPAQGRVASIRHCGDTYVVTTADGKVNKVWEFNLRFKTDSSALGPAPGKPVVVGAGMRGDRASIVFAAPDEISRFIKASCE